MSYPIRDTGENETPKGECLACPHVHCEYCEYTIATVPDEHEALRDILIHIRDTHNDEWMGPECAEYRMNATHFGVEAL